MAVVHCSYFEGISGETWKPTGRDTRWRQSRLTDKLDLRPVREIRSEGTQQYKM